MLADDYKRNINASTKEDEGEDGSTNDGSESTSCVTKSRDIDFYLGGKVKKAELQRMCTDKNISASVQSKK